jgi:hypothetical protein
MRLRAILVGVGLGVSASFASFGCTTDGDGGDSIQVPWVAGRIGVSPVDLPRLEGHGQLWIVGDGVSMPLHSLPEDLSPEVAWPDVVVPPDADMAVGAHLGAYTVSQGKPDELVADLVVSSVSSEVARVGVWGVTKTCFSYCEYGVCGGTSCSNCSICANQGLNCFGMLGHNHQGVGSAFVCNDDHICGGCWGGSQHHCWTENVLMSCG